MWTVHQTETFKSWFEALDDSAKEDIYAMKKKQPQYTEFFSSAKKTMTPESVRRAEQKAQNVIVRLRLAELRKKADLKQSEISGFSQTSISRLEGRSDLKISTLIEYVHALGMGLEIKAVQKKRSALPREIIILKQ